MDVLRCRALPPRRIRACRLVCVLLRVSFGVVCATAVPALGLAQPADAAHADDVAEVLALEAKIAEAIVAGDVSFVSSVLADDFRMTHGDAWTRGEPPALVDDKASFLKRVEDKIYAAIDHDSVQVEMHAGLAMTYGRYIGHIPGSPQGRRWFSVWYVKVYEQRDGRWVYLSHRTVRGAHYGLSRDDVGDF